MRELLPVKKVKEQSRNIPCQECLSWAVVSHYTTAVYSNDNSGVNLWEEVFPDGYPISKVWGPLTLKTTAFICNFTSAITPMIFPRYLAFSCNVPIQSNDYITVLWVHVSVGGQNDKFLFGCIILIYRIYIRICFITTSICPMRMSDT